jgi:thiol:disulfide interchange protein
MKKILTSSLFAIIFIFSINAQILDPVKWKHDYSIVKENIVELRFTANIEKNWHMYGVNMPADGPVPTSITLEKNSTFELLGGIVEISKPEKKFDPNFNMDIYLHSNKAVFVHKVKLKAEGKTQIKATVEYMVCDDQKCLPPKEKEFDFAIQYEKKAIVNEIPVPATVLESDTLTKQKDTLIAEKTIVAENKDEEKKSSLWGFILLAFLAGLAGILTPCVFPMIPMTVTFFLRGSENRSKGIFKGLIFGISIAAIYTLIGVLVALTSAGSGFANQLSTHWIPNLIFFLVFVIFAASFFGMFELVLPSGIINKADQQADKGGYLGVFFMALATVLVSFSCTGPIVGAILVEAASGVALKPILGMLAFGAAFALPFTLLAIFPATLKTLPKSGGWLNSVKIVLGFIILGFSLKYLSNIDQSYHFGILSRNVYLIVWIVLSVLLGLYLMGKIKFSHDSEVQHISFPRFLLVVLAFVFALYLFKGYLGAPLARISSLLPPQEIAKRQFVSNNQAKSLLCNTPKYSDILHLPYNLEGYYDLNEGLTCAKQQNKPVFLDFKGHACSNCKEMEAKVWSDPEVRKLLSENYIVIALYVDDRTPLAENDQVVSKLDGKLKKNIGQLNADLQAYMFKTNTQPYYIVVDSTGKSIVEAYNNKIDIGVFKEYLKKGIEKYKTR